MTARLTDRVLIEQAVARGWGDERIASDLDVSIRAVVHARRALDELVDADAFAVIGVDTCAKGHRFTPENTYQRPGPTGQKECRTCRNDRNRSRYRVTATVDDRRPERSAVVRADVWLESVPASAV